jgi:hypothetical protein
MSPWEAPTSVGGGWPSGRPTEAPKKSRALAPEVPPCFCVEVLSKTMKDSSDFDEQDPWPGNDPGELVRLGQPHRPLELGSLPAVARPSPDAFTKPVAAKFTPTSNRPCLYIGPSGERCNANATRGDFCSRHSAPDPAAPSEKVIVKRAVAVGGVIAVLWPLIWDLLRALLRLLR